MSRPPSARSPDACCPSSRTTSAVIWSGSFWSEHRVEVVPGPVRGAVHARASKLFDPAKVRVAWDPAYATRIDVVLPPSDLPARMRVLAREGDRSLTPSFDATLRADAGSSDHTSFWLVARSWDPTARRWVWSWLLPPGRHTLQVSATPAPELALEDSARVSEVLDASFVKEIVVDIPPGDPDMTK